MSLTPVRFDASGSSDEDGTIVAYLWYVAGVLAGSGPTFTTSFPLAGPSTVLLEVTDDYGGNATATLSITVGNRPPVAIVNQSALVIESMGSVQFSANGSFDPDGSLSNFLFEFEPGVTSVEEVGFADATFPRPGIRGGWLTVTDNLGGTARIRLSVEVTNRAPQVVWVPGPITQGNESVALAFGARAADTDGEIVAFTLDFGDGIRATRSTAGSPVDIAELHEYVGEGNFAVTLTVTDDLGAQAVLSTVVAVEHPAPTVTMAEVRVAGGNFTVEYAATSPYGGLELIVEVNGSIWRQVGIEDVGTVNFQTSSLQPGAYTFQVFVSDGTDRSAAASGNFTVAATEGPPPPPPPPPPKDGAPPNFTLLFGLVGVGAFGAAAAFALIKRKKR
jgi:hypothetical protein